MFITDLSFEEIRSIELPFGHQIPTLEEVVDLCQGKIVMNMEIKERSTDIIQILIDFIKEKGLTENQVYFSSFRHYLLEMLDFGQKSYLYSTLDHELIPEDYQSPGDMVSICHASLNKELADTVHANGQKLVVYFEDFHPELTEYYPNMMDLGVDIVISDRPMDLKKFLANLKQT